MNIVPVAYEDDHFAAVIKPQGMLTVRMGSVQAPGPALSSCIKHTLRMPRIPGVYRILTSTQPRVCSVLQRVPCAQHCLQGPDTKVGIVEKRRHLKC